MPISPNSARRAKWTGSSSPVILGTQVRPVLYANRMMKPLGACISVAAAHARSKGPLFLLISARI